MAESSWPSVAGGRVVDDVQYEQMAVGYAADGVIGATTDSTVVYADSSGMQVKIRPNKTGLVRGRTWFSGATEFTKAIAANVSGSTRIDRVVLRLDRATWAVTVQVKQGTPGSGAPALTQVATGSSSGTYEVPLATVTITSGASSITAVMVTPEQRYIGPSSTPGRPKVYSHTTPMALSAAFTNTAQPTSDTFNATGMFPYSASRLTLDKQSPDSSIEVRLDLSGFTNTPGKVTAGVRVMATGYTSSNHVVCSQHFTYPYTGGTNASNYLTTDQSDGRHWHNIGQHSHLIGLASMHLTWGGYLHIPALATRTYSIQAWITVASGLTFTMDANDQLFLRVAEV